MLTGRILENQARPLCHLRLDPSRCLRMRYSGSSCARCATVCPAAAISLVEGLAVREECCTGCLACTTVCPSGALESGEDFSRILAALGAHRFPVFVIGCGKSGNRCHGELPCLGMLSAEHLVALYAHGEAMVQLDASACAKCPAGAMLARLEERLRQTGEAAGLPPHRRLRLVSDPREIDFRQEGVDRRTFFTALRKKAFQGVAAALAPPSGESRCMSYMDKALPARRGILLAALDSLPAEEAPAVRKAFTFSATFNGSCDGCLGCVRACPTAALSEPGEDGASPPRFDPKRCTGCRLCSEFCLSGAVEIGPAAFAR